MSEDKKKAELVVFCIPTMTKPMQVTIDSIFGCLDGLENAGYGHKMVSEIGCPYISQARATMLRKALDAKADHIVFIDHDISFSPDDMLKLVQCEGDVSAGTYRFKRDKEEYMGKFMAGPNGKPICRDSDHAIMMHSVPAGFLRITKHAVNVFMAEYPELCYGDRFNPHIDLFNHGAHEWVWYGEDYAFSRRWRERCGDIWCIPDMTINHHTADQCYPGNYHEWLLKQPGGINDNSTAGH